jgi:hypothetical protein
MSRKYLLYLDEFEMRIITILVDSVLGSPDRFSNVAMITLTSILDEINETKKSIEVITRRDQQGQGQD